jgi:hypothetical protein
MRTLDPGQFSYAAAAAASINPGPRDRFAGKTLARGFVPLHGLWRAIESAI